MIGIGVVEIITILGLIGGFVATVVTTTWKMSTLAGKIEKNENTAVKAHERLDKYVSKHETAIEELKQQVNNILQTQVRIEQQLTFLIEQNRNN